jgi:peptide deformylase
MAKRKRRRHIFAHAPSASTPTIGNQEQKHEDGVLQIRLYGDPVLRQKASPIESLTSAEKELADSMLATLYAIPNGVGLAAPQVGVLKRLVVIDVDREDLDSKPLVLINPKIQSLEGEIVDEEACLSIPDVTADVKRAEKVVVTALSLDGEEFSVEGEGFFARVLQHEIDHLDGVLFIDHIGGLKRQLLRKKLHKLQQQSQDEREEKCHRLAR